jgi:ferredoxin
MTETTDSIQNAMRETAASLLTEQQVNMVIGYGADTEGNVSPAFIKEAGQAGQLVWNNTCFNNLAVYLTRDHVKKYFPVGIVIKGCDLRAVNMLLKENIFTRDEVVLIGLPCSGAGDPVLEKCKFCTVQLPDDVDHLMPGTPGKIEATEEAFAEVDRMEALPPEERWAFWKGHFERCIRCYACRQVCPMCYCKRCIVEKNQPQWVETSPHLRGNTAWNVIRAFHLTGRCVGCGECERVCPAGIPLNRINDKMVKVVLDEFNYQAGMDNTTPSPFTTFDLGVDTDEGIL